MLAAAIRTYPRGGGAGDCIDGCGGWGGCCCGRVGCGTRPDALPADQTGLADQAGPQLSGAAARAAHRLPLQVQVFVFVQSDPTHQDHCAQRRPLPPHPPRMATLARAALPSRSLPLSTGRSWQRQGPPDQCPTEQRWTAPASPVPIAHRPLIDCPRTGSRRRLGIAPARQRRRCGAAMAANPRRTAPFHGARSTQLRTAARGPPVCHCGDLDRRDRSSRGSGRPGTGSWGWGKGGGKKNHKKKKPQKKKCQKIMPKP
jgi:hypothetical protein